MGSNETSDVADLLLQGSITWPSRDAARRSIALRPLDGNWKYSGVLPSLFSGFNPFYGKPQVAFNSYLAAFLFGQTSGMRIDLAQASPQQMAREILFAFHDHIHCCVISVCVRWITEKCNFNDLSKVERRALLFHALALSEVAATLGLDYWRISRQGPIGPKYSGHPFTGLTTSFDRQTEHKAVVDYVDSSQFFFDLLELFMDEPRPQNTVSRDWFQREVFQASIWNKLMKGWLSFRLGIDRRVPGGRSDAVLDLTGALTKEVCALTQKFAYDDPSALFQFTPKDIDATLFDDYRPTSVEPRFQALGGLDAPIPDTLWEGLMTLPQRQFGYFVGQVHSYGWYTGAGSEYCDEFDRLIMERDRAGIERFMHNRERVHVDPTLAARGDGYFVFPS